MNGSNGASVSTFSHRADQYSVDVGANDLQFSSVKHVESVDGIVNSIPATSKSIETIDVNHIPVLENGENHGNQAGKQYIEDGYVPGGPFPRSCFCWGSYEAPEARPWVVMHAVVGICVIHFSIAISQAILYTASAVADSNQRMPMLFNIRAGNTQIAVNIIVSIINFALLPTIGAISDYTRFRYHVGCTALLAVCCSEFVSAAASTAVRTPNIPAAPSTPPNFDALRLADPPSSLPLGAP